MITNLDLARSLELEANLAKKYLLPFNFMHSNWNLRYF